MKKILISWLVGVVLGLAGGFALGIFVYPYLFLADIVAEETVSGAGERQAVAKGTFIHVNPSDPIHHGKGSVTAYADLIHLESDFEVGPGPKFHVYLVPVENVRSDADVEDSMFVDLGRLRAFKGSQNYPIPAGVDLAMYRSVVIWCEQFGVLITTATLEFGKGASA